MTLEAEVLARHLHAERSAAPIVQVYRREPRGMTAAAALRSALAIRGITAVRDAVIERDDDLARVTGQVPGDEPGASLVLWLEDRDLPPIAELAGAGRIYLSTTLVGALPRALPEGFENRVYAVHPYHLPQDAASRLRAMESWLRSKGVALSDERVQANTFFTVNLVAQALKHLRSNFHRDYFLQRIEHIFDTMVTPAAYPRASLGPNQRYASKGGYILRLTQGPNGELTPVGEWIVP
jgi:hypothetical protein